MADFLSFVVCLRSFLPALLLFFFLKCWLFGGVVLFDCLTT